MATIRATVHLLNVEADTNPLVHINTAYPNYHQVAGMLSVAQEQGGFFIKTETGFEYIPFYNVSRISFETIELPVAANS